MVMVGRSDKVCGMFPNELDRYMKAQNIPSDFYDTAGGHETTVWQKRAVQISPRNCIEIAITRVLIFGDNQLEGALGTG